MNNTWEIIDTPTDPTFGISVASTNPDAAWPYFFNGIMPRTYPELIATAVDEIGYDSNGTGITFPGDLDDFERLSTSIQDNFVEIYVPGFDESILPRSLFYAVLLAFAERLMKRPGQPADWYTTMHTVLEKLRTKIAADAASPSIHR